MAKTASILAEENDFLEQTAQKMLKEVIIKKGAEKMRLSVTKLLQQHSAIRKRI